MSAYDDMKCADCGKTPRECGYAAYAEVGQSANDYAWAEEGTMDHATGLFLCDSCYIKHGQPSGSWPNRWTATPKNLAELGIS